MRKAIKVLKQYMTENAKFGEFSLLQAGHTQWFKAIMKLQPEEEPETSSEEDEAQEMDREQVGKVPIYYCKKCQWRVGGFTCRALRKKISCGEVLLVQQDGSLRCPKGCGVMSAPRCCRNWTMRAEVNPMYNIGALPSTHVDDISWDACPVFSCRKCGFGVDGIRCFTCTKAGNSVTRSGFFERVWCMYVWICPKGCGRQKRGGLTLGGFINCKCQGENGTPLIEHTYVEKFGPPQN